MQAIIKKTIKSYFASSFSWVFIGVFFLLSALNFAPLLIQKSTEVQGLLSSLVNAALFLMPLLAVGLWTREECRGTDKLLFSSPLSSLTILFAKYLGGLIFALIPIFSTLLIFILTAFLAKIDVAQLVMAYIAFILLSSLLIAVGLFFSSLTNKTENAALGAVGLAVVINSIGILKSIPDAPKFVTGIADFLSVSQKYSELSGTIISPAPIIYFLSLTALFIYAASLVVNCKKSK